MSARPPIFSKKEIRVDLCPFVVTCFARGDIAIEK